MDRIDGIERGAAPGPGGQGGADERTAAARGAVLAGGRGSRLGGEKATADLAGRPLISYPLAALAAADLDPFVVAKPDARDRGRPLAREPDRGRPLARPSDRGRPLARIPELRSTAPAEAGQRSTAPVGIGEIEVVTEPPEPVHPLAGIVAALRHVGAPVLVLGCDFPFVPPELLRALAAAPERLVVPAPGGDLQPLVARWSPDLLPELDAALAREEPLRRTVASLSPRLLEDADLARFGDPARVFFNVNTPADLRAAADLL